MTDANPHATKHPFGPSYQLRELPDGQVIPGAAYAPDPRPVHRMMTIALRQRWPDFPYGLKVADLACNGGFHGIKLLRDGARECSFVDMDVESIKVAKETARAWDVHRLGCFLDGDIESFDPLASFDLIMAHQVIYHLADPIGFLRRVHRGLKPDGAFAMYTRIAHAVHPRTHEWVPSWQTMQETLQHIGFKSVTFLGEEDVVKKVHPSTRDIRSAGQEKLLVVAFCS